MNDSFERQSFFPSLTSALVSDTPIIIPTFNNPSYASRMVSQLIRLQHKNIILIDSHSTTPEMMDFLSKSKSVARVIRLSYNAGPHHIFKDQEGYNALPDIFCLSDPDLEFNEKMPANFVETLILLTKHFKIGKVGLALKIDDKDLMRPVKFRIGENEYNPWEWEARFWVDRIGKLPDESSVFRAAIDTTFAVYNKEFFVRNDFRAALRVGGNYTCRHLPWYIDNKLPTSEEETYRRTQQYSYHLR